MKHLVDGLESDDCVPDGRDERSPLAGALRAVIGANLPAGASGVAGWLELTLGITRNSAYRKLRGESAFTDGELAQIARALKLSLNRLLIELADALDQGGAELAARTTLGGVPVGVRIRTGSPVRQPTPGQLVAVQRDGQWEAVEGGHVRPGEATFSLQSLRFEGPRRPRVALLDDEPAVVDLAAELMTEYGWDCDKFTASEGLLQALPVTRYDALVLDWRLARGDTCESIVEAVRSAPDGIDTPVFVITGQLGTGPHNNLLRDLERLVQTYKVSPKEKPVNWGLLVVEMNARANLGPVGGVAGSA